MAKTSLHTHTAVARLPGVSQAFSLVHVKLSYDISYVSVLSVYCIIVRCEAVYGRPS